MMRGALGLLLATTIACGDDGGADGELRTVDGPAPGVGLRVLVQDFAEGVFFAVAPPLGGVEVCVESSRPTWCTTSDAEGWAWIPGLEPDEEILLTFTREGYTPALRPLVAPRTSATLEVFSRMAMTSVEEWRTRRDDLNATLEAMGLEPVTDDRTRGIVAFGVTDRGGFQEPLARTSVDLDGGTSRGPFFADQMQRLAPGPPNQSDWAAFYDVAPGEIELVFEPDDGSCVWTAGPQTGWPSKGGRNNAMRLPVRAGHVTGWMVMECPLDDDADAGI